MKRCIRKGVTFGRVLREYKRDGRIWSYHATKGWRSSRA